MKSADKLMPSFREGRSKLSFVLPVTLHEKGLSSARRNSWRHSPDDGTAIRTRLLLASFLNNFAQDDLLEFLVVCPPNDISCLSETLRSVTTDSRYRIISEDDICPDFRLAISRETGEVNGWLAQQLIKLSVATRITSRHYVTLDSDILCVKPFAFETLINNGAALTNIESSSDYQRIYHEDSARREAAIKVRRYGTSAEILGYVRPRTLLFRFYGETPVVLQTASVLAMTEHLNKRFFCPWSRALATRSGWTEYSLYFQFLEMTGQLESVCVLAGCNAVLDLEKSV